MKGSLRRIAPVALASLVTTMPAFPADPPSPGQIFQQQQRSEDPRRPTAPKPPAAEEKDDGPDFTPAGRKEESAPAATSATRKVAVKAFRLVGLTVAPDASVQARLEKHRNRESTVTELHEAATVVQDYLRGLGFYARVYVPTQDVRDGVVELRIVESRISTVEVQRGEGLRVGNETLTRYFSHGQDELLKESQMEHDLLLVNELAGVRARAILVPGKDPGTTTLLLSAMADPYVQGYVSADNAGSKYTGRERADVDVRLNSPFGLGDQLSAHGSVSRHSNFVRAAYSVPVNASGLSVGGAYAYNDYSLCCDFAALAQTGWARSGNLFANYPILRSTGRNISASIVYSDRRIVGNSLGALTSDHRIASWTPGIFGDWQDKFWDLTARTSWSVQLATGRVDLAPSPDRASDAATAATNGRYEKIAFNMARLQKLGEHWTLLASARGQLAGKNLDSSEKLILGGISGVRAYPTGEGVGDAGYILSAEFQREIFPQWVGSLFYDYGYLQLHQKPWANWQAGNPTIQNKYGLSGAGVGVTWIPNPRTTLRAMIASPIGSNTGRDASGRNSENTRDGARLWASLSWSF